MSDDRSNKEIFKAAILAELKRQSEGMHTPYWNEDTEVFDGDLDVDQLADAVENAMVNAQMGRG